MRNEKDQKALRAELSAMRRSYGDAGLSESQVEAHPIEQFQRWLAEAALNPYIVEANAMVLSTIEGLADGTLRPASRTVLLKDVEVDGESGTLSFFTNYASNKARQIDTNPQVSLLFPWYPMERQVIVKGLASKVERSVSEAYFSTRPWGSQIGAWASEQSSELESREVLEARYQALAVKYPEGTTVPTPPHWGGFEVRPTTIEFWQGRYSRLHDRIIYTYTDNGWSRGRLYP